MTPMVEARGLTKRYEDRTVLDGIDFRIGRGERVALLGTNGAGKTTLFRCLLGLVGFEGRLEVDGRAAGAGAREVRALLAYVPQQPPLFDLSVAGFLDFFAGLRGIAPPDVHARLEGLGLPFGEVAAKPLRELSGGMLQKAYLALALATRAPVLILDEPTASLDPASRRDFLRHLAEVDADTTMILASHRLEEIEPLASRILVLAEGRLAFDGPAAELWRSETVEARLGEIRGGRRPAPALEDLLAGLLAVRAAGWP